MTKAFLTLFSGSLLSKVIGLFRELIFAFYYGTTAIASSFRLSQTAIFIPIQFLTTDIFNAGFLPLYTKYLKIDYKKATIFYWIIQTLLIVLSLFLTTMLFFYANSIIRLLAPGFNEENIAIAISFLKILSFAIPFFLLSGLFNYLEMAHNSYFLASIRTVIQSLGIILGVLLSHYFNNILLLAWGFNIAYILFFIISLIRVIRLKRVPSLSLFDKTVVKEVFNRFILIIKPLLLLPFLLQANIAIERMIASLISIDSIASFDYARFVTETVVVLLAVPVGLISLSSFSTLDREELNQKLKKIISILTIISLPITLYLAINSELIVRVIFERGAFDKSSVETTTAILFGFSIGIFFQTIQYVLIKVLNTRFENGKVLLFMAIGLSMNIIFNLLFYKIFGIATLGYAYSLYGFIVFILTLREFKFLGYMGHKLFYLSIFGIGYIIISLFINFENILIDFFVSLIIFLLYWSFAIIITPGLNADIKGYR